MQHQPQPQLTGLRRFMVEFWFFCLSLLRWKFSKPRRPSVRVATSISPTPNASACRCLPVLCIRRSAAAALTICLDFFTHHYIGDYRRSIAVFASGLYARTIVRFTPCGKVRRMPLLLSFCLIGLFVRLAENISTFAGIWRYPNQIGGWSMVHLGKRGAWSLLVVITFTITANLKHIKSTIKVP